MNVLIYIIIVFNKLFLKKKINNLLGSKDQFYLIIKLNSNCVLNLFGIGSTCRVEFHN